MRDLKTLISIGNSKIAKNTGIFNLCSATDCPVKSMCSYGKTGKCYALKSERLYPQVLPYRREQQLYWNERSLSDKIDDFVKFFESRKNLKYLRINESGDIASIDDLIHLNAIARELKLIGINTYTYTHNLSVLAQYTPSDIVVNLSIDDINIDYANETGLLYEYNVFMGVKSLPTNHLFQVCKGKCMSECTLCVINHGNITIIKEH